MPVHVAPGRALYRLSGGSLIRIDAGATQQPAADPAAFRSVSTVYNLGGASQTVPCPAGAAAGDLLVATRTTQSDTTTGVPAGSGWELAETVGASGNVMHVFTLRLASAPPASWTWPNGGGDNDYLTHVVAVQNPDPDLAPVVATAQNTSNLAPSVTPPSSAGGVFLSFVGSLHSARPTGSLTVPPGMTLRDSQVGPAADAWAAQAVASQDIADGTATGTRAWGNTLTPAAAAEQYASVLVPSAGGTSPPQPEPTARADYYGIADPYASVQGLSSAQMDAYFANIVATGATWWRTDVRAFEIETSNGNRNWTELDLVVARAKAAGLRLLLCPSTLPSWARTAAPADSRRGAITTAEQDAFAAFFAACVSRYQQVDAWEVWNEPNYGNFWSPEPTDSTVYASLLAKAYAAAKPLAPAGVPILAGGTAVVGVRANAWYSNLYAQGGGANCDGVCVHPYPNVGWSRAGQYFTGAEMEDVAAIRATMDTAGDTAKKIWATENGYPTFSGWSPPLTEAEQAAWMPDVWEGWYDQTTGRGATGPSFLYQYQDQDTSDTTDPEAHFGIVRSDGTLKPAHGTMQNWAGEPTSEPPGQAEITAVTPGSGDALVAWGAVGGATGYRVAWTPVQGPESDLDGSWSLAFSDDFDGASLDTTKWNPYPLNVWPYDGSPGYGHAYNKGIEDAWFKEANLSFADSALGMTVVSDPATYDVGTANETSYRFSSGSVTTEGKFLAQPGDFIEARAWVAAAADAGTGLWPAFWTSVTSIEWPPEFDIYEFFRLERAPSSGEWAHGMRIPKSNYHYGDTWETHQQTGAKYYGPTDGTDLRGNWHVYGMHWHPDASNAAAPYGARFYVDGVAYPGADIPSGLGNLTEPQFIILNLSTYRFSEADGVTPTSPALGVPAHRFDWVRTWRPA